MGWSFDIHDCGRDAFVRRITSQTHFSEGIKLIASRVIGNHIWQVIEDKDGRRLITLDLIAKQRGGGWGSKGLSEDMGPYYYDCPLTLLKIAGEPINESVRAWREKVVAYQAVRAQARRRKRAPGDHILVNGERYALIEPLQGRPGWRIRSLDSGYTYWISSRSLNRATPIEKEAA